MMIVPITLLFAFFGSTFGYEGLALGGYGATNFIELIEGGKICGGDDVTPSLPSVIPAANPTWVAEFVDNAIYLCGGQNLEQRRDCYRYEPGINAKFELACPMSDDRKYPASLVHNDEMYVLGGYNDAAGWLDSVDVKPSGQCEFQQKEEWKMLRGMYNFCAVSHEDKIYTIGGSVYAFLENSDIANVDVLDTTTNTWTSAEPLPQSRSASGCAVYELNGDMGILVAGGCDDSCHEHLDDTLFFSFATQSWQTLPAKLNTPRMGMRMIIVGGKPTLIGGYYTDLLESVEEFDGSSWSMRGNLAFGRYQYGMPSTMPENILSCPDA